jgi:hypothetical protein
MMHVPPASFRPDPVQADAAPSPVPPVTPAAYLRLRRVHAGLTVAQLASRITANPDQHSMATAMIHLLETPGVVARHAETTRALARVLPFDASVYWQLAHDPVEAHPRVCRGCGYTIWDAYSVEDQLLGWTTDTSCTRCTPAADADR